MRQNQETIDNGYIKYQDMVLRFEEVKKNERKLSEVLGNTIKELEAIKEEKERILEELKVLKSSTPTSKQTADLNIAGPYFTMEAWYGYGS